MTKQTVIMQLSTGTEEWSIDELARWMCLMEAYDIIHQKAEQLGVFIGDKMNARAIEEYIYGSGTSNKRYDGRFHSMRHDIGVELELGNL